MGVGQAREEPHKRRQVMVKAQPEVPFKAEILVRRFRSQKELCCFKRKEKKKKREQ